MRKEINFTKEQLQELKENHTIMEMAEILDCGEITVCRYMRKFGLYRERPWTDKNWLEEQLKDKNVTEIAEEYNTSACTINRWIKRNKISVQKKVPVYKQRKWLIKELSKRNWSITKLAEETGHSETSLRKYIKQLNVKMPEKKIKYFETFFEKINTEEKAYWLGFLMADGHVDKDLGKLTLTLKASDYNHLEKLMNTLKEDKKITIQEITGGGAKPRKTATIYYCSTYMIKKLVYNGVVPLKSGKKVLPKTVPLHLIKDFIRGFWDGDGHINSNRRLVSVCSSSLNVLFSIRFYFEEMLGVKHYELQYYKWNHMYVYTLFSENAKNVVEHLYSGASIYLDRKHETAMSLISRKDKRSLKSTKNRGTLKTENPEPKEA
nr:MAG TPA: HNH endonuclease [Bacteriophage sp.]